ncbi:unnamed protein product [Paramecium pentaurelia]|uniref:WD40-repeat-containing domain n=1 Tax=Paramecium pentaurelia TaxID=43138 RepID=A0A8S1SP15_9CILI|nr:unnamed protein product [Paramecium pentaurelia]
MQIRCISADHQNQQITGFCIDSKCPNQRHYCKVCLPSHNLHLNKLISQELLYQWVKERILMLKYLKNNVQEFKFALDSLINLFLPFNNFNIQQLSELELSQIDQLITGLCQMADCEEELFKQLQQSIEQTKSIVNQILKKLKSQTNQNQNGNLQIPQFNIDKSTLEQTNNQSILEPNVKLFTFDFMKQNIIKQNESCNAIAFNKDYSIVITGCKKDIKVFQNNQGKLNQIQLLSEHTSNVYSLNFLKNINNFVSGSDDSSIIIWQAIGNNQWQSQQKLNGHSLAIFCLLLNNTDDLIISGSADKTIKIWVKQDQWLCQQTITDHTNQVYSISLNEEQNKLISCSFDYQILVIEQQNMDKKWIVKQQIKLDTWGYRLCQINDNQFTFQPYCKQQMHVYEMDNNTKQYRKTKEIAVKSGSSVDNCFFPQQYLKSKCLLVNKNGNYINLMRKTENGDFKVQQSIKIGNFHIYGQLSNDGEYLITWDDGSKEIQIRKCREL